MGSLAVAWLELTVRWIHVIAGVAWIGTSFYFNWLNDRLTTPTDAPEGVTGELWSVHGGGFYRVMKFGVAPARMPEELHWFKWEAYLTALSGLALLVLVYYLGADVYMVVPGGLSPGAAVGVGVATLIGGWLVYDALCRSPLGRRTPALAAVGFLLATLIAWGLVQFIGSRAAYIHIGAMLGTIMALNVFRVIIPAQREMVADLVAGREPDGAVGEHAALRSLHNNYMTLPVLFIMVSIHYAMTYGHRYNWAILAALALIGAGTRHYFNLRNRGRHNGLDPPGSRVGHGGARLRVLRTFATPAGRPRGWGDRFLRGRPRRDRRALCRLPLGATLARTLRCATSGGDVRYARAHPGLCGSDLRHRGGVDGHAARQLHRDDRRGTGIDRGLDPSGCGDRIGRGLNGILFPVLGKNLLENRAIPGQKAVGLEFSTWHGSRK